MGLKGLIKIAFVFLWFGEVFGQTGCTDPLANNYNPEATQNDGSCTYDTTIVNPASSVSLDESMRETSGLIYWMNSLWTHNDSSDSNLYQINPANGHLLSSVALNYVENVDWEDIAQDESYVYLGDFGNNLHGNRTDLRIIRIEKATMLREVPQLDFINFSYVDQTDFTSQEVNNTDYDCEALIVYGDYLFLFTKEWVSNRTKLYKLPKTPGTYVAQLEDSYDVEGMITGAEIYEDIIVLSGYTNLVMPFLFLLYDFDEDDFFGGNKRKLELSLFLHQVEGIATSNGLNYYITNEQVAILGIDPQLHSLDLTPYLENSTLGLESPNVKNNLEIVPNPGTSKVEVMGLENNYPITFQIVDMMGQVLQKGELELQQPFIDISELSVGVYVLMFPKSNKQSQLLVKK
ncbi:T9SS type A sorting domain-containing protein [Mangrovimonas sp. TPBH4]|uniref:T9SS type A sorting domain-containing protein n=1 Tax=Mangrovimonas sp. TPBH4 TaxID=1645914 RepID=UPI000A4218CB|nr:T9SS type A sorting domain-containing protein [Mangrovimonas sp. TPBH4]